MVHDLEEVVNVWKSHYAALSTEKQLPRFDNAHYDMVTEKVSSWYRGNDSGRFLEENLSTEEVTKAIKKTE